MNETICDSQPFAVVVFVDPRSDSQITVLDHANAVEQVVEELSSVLFSIWKRVAAATHVVDAV